jgi:hypothetical protein
MDHSTKQKINELAKLYLNGNEDSLLKLGEINEEYLELFPIIRELTSQIIEKENKNYKAYQDEHLKDALKEYSSNNDELIKKLNKIKEVYINLEKNKKELSDIINEE